MYFIEKYNQCRLRMHSVATIQRFFQGRQGILTSIAIAISRGSITAAMVKGTLVIYTASLHSCY